MVHSDAIWNDVFFKFELLRKLWKQGENVVHSDAIWNDVLEFGTGEKILKLWNDIWCILTLF